MRFDELAAHACRTPFGIQRIGILDVQVYTALVVVARERQELPDGYAFRFEPKCFELVARFVENECKCCPFVDFDISLKRSPDELWLSMMGPEGTRSVLDAELNLTSPCACN